MALWWNSFGSGRCGPSVGRFVFACGLLLLASCMVNPVTGQRNLGLVTPQQERALGETHFGPLQQMEGGRYRADPMLNAYVNGVGHRVAAASGVSLPYEFVVLNNDVPNAWALPGGKIGVNRGLLVELNNEAELAAVLGHEVAHSAARHGAQQMERGMLMQGALVAAAVGTRRSDYAVAVLGAGQIGATLVTQRYSREAEREADYFGTRWMTSAGYDPQAAVSLQETFVRLAGSRNQDWLSGLFASHPPSTERVENNRELARSLGDRGELGEARFNAALAHLKQAQPAYEDARAAREAAGRGDWGSAMGLVAAAIEHEPAEAAFHALRGDLLRAQREYDAALSAYDDALHRDSQYFGHHLGRGLTLQRLGQYDRAQRDLRRSIELLPTAVAYQSLGQIAEQQGDREAALAYYRIAGESGSPAGRAALSRVVSLDMPRNPGRYVQVALAGSGEDLRLQVTSLTDIDLRDVNVRVRLEWADGQVDNLLPQISHLRARQRAEISLPGREASLAAARVFPLTGRPASGSEDI